MYFNKVITKPSSITKPLSQYKSYNSNTISIFFFLIFFVSFDVVIASNSISFVSTGVGDCITVINAVFSVNFALFFIQFVNK